MDYLLIWYYIDEGFRFLLSSLGYFFNCLFEFNLYDNPAQGWLSLWPFIGVVMAFPIFKFGIKIVKSMAFGF